LRNTEFALCAALSTAAAEDAEQRDQSKKRGDWRGNEPWLRLIMCACDDRAGEALLTKDMLLDQQQLDARNNDDRPQTFDEVVANLFNDNEFEPVTESLPNLSSTFSEPIELPFSLMPGEVTPEQVKSKLADARCRLMKVINRWERSGNGFGQMHDEEGDFVNPVNCGDQENEADPQDHEKQVTDNHGHVIEENFVDGDNRQSFLWYHAGDKDFPLCFWHVLDSEGALSKVINQLDCTVAVDCDSQLPDVTQVEHRGKKRKQVKADNDKDEKSFHVEVGSALSGLTYQAMVENRDRVRRIVHECHIQKIHEPDAAAKKELHNIIAEAKGDLAQLEAQMLDYEKQFNLKQKAKANKNQA